jgi:hypothetical protein
VKQQAKPRETRRSNRNRVTLFSWNLKPSNLGLYWRFPVSSQQPLVKPMTRPYLNINNSKFVSTAYSQIPQKFSEKGKYVLFNSESVLDRLFVLCESMYMVNGKYCSMQTIQQLYIKDVYCLTKK